MAIQNLSFDSHKALLDAAAVCARLSREAGERRDTHLASGDVTRARLEGSAASACLDCGEAILALVTP